MSSFASEAAAGCRPRAPGVARRRWRAAAAALLLAGTAAAPGLGAPGLETYERTTPKALADVVDDLEFAITERNFRVTGRLSIGKAIRERDEGEFPDYEVILFCNLEFAREMLTLSPDYVLFCPGKVAVRGTASGLVISTPLIPEDSGRRELDALAARINALLRQIVDDGAAPWSRAGVARR